MSCTLPKIFGSGIFDTASRLKYRDFNILFPTPLRTVKEYELELFLDDGGVSVINGKQYKIKKGSILFASPGDKRQSFLHFKALFVHFGVSDHKIAKIIKSIPSFSEGYNFENYFKLFSDICSSDISNDSCNDILSEARLLELICKLKTDNAVEIRKINSNSDRPDIVKAIEYINEHFSDSLIVDDLAKLCNLSTSYFYKIFTQITDSTPNGYIIKKRLSEATNLLVTTELPIIDIAMKCGFNSQSYFCFCFKSNFEISPSEYRKKHYYNI